MSIAHFLKLADATGGKTFTFAGNTDSVMISILQSLGRDVLQRDYLVGYYPASADKEKSREVQVLLRDKAKGIIVGGTRLLLH